MSKGPSLPTKLLYTRRHSSDVLDASIDVVKELEKLGRLTPIRLTGPRGLVHYRAEQVHALAEESAGVSTAAPASTVPLRRSSK